MKSLRLTDKYLKVSASKNIAHVLQYANFQLCKTYFAAAIWKNREMMTNI